METDPALQRKANMDLMGLDDIPSRSRFRQARIAVVIPFYNQLYKLKRTLDSIIAQDLRPATVVLVDDRGSERLDAALMDSLEKAGIHTKLIVNERNLGPGGSRQAGFSSLPDDTEYVQFLDSDDHISERFLHACVAVHRNRPDIIATYGDSVHTDKGLSRVMASLPPSNLLDGIVNKRPWGTGALLWKYSQIRGLEWMPWTTLEDTQFELSAAMVNHRICFVPEAVLYIDQDFSAERMKERNHYFEKRENLKIRSRIFERILLDFPFERLESGSSWYIKRAAYELSIFFRDGTASYASLFLRLLARGRFMGALHLAYRYPGYLSRRRRRE
jgi:glycosyltransferase involved in cell wall biosynthesis